jgi:hypothetical protein
MTSSHEPGVSGSVFESRLADISRRLGNSVHAINMRLSKGQSQVNDFRLLSQVLKVGRFLPSAVAIATSIFSVVRLKPVLTVLLFSATGLFLKDWLSKNPALSETSND